MSEAEHVAERVFVLRKRMNSGALQVSRQCREIFGQRKPHLHVCGVNTKYCVKSTAALLVIHGFPVSVIASACNDETEERHKVGLREMSRRGVQVVGRRK
jgi:nicotinamidase-related amidase